MSPNQIVAYNLRNARLLQNWTQDTATEKLAPLLGVRWSKASYSAAERSVTGTRIRQFTADEIVAFATAFELSVSFFLTPPPGVDTIALPAATTKITPAALADVVGPPPVEKIKRLGVKEWERLEAMGLQVTEVSAMHVGPVKRPRKKED